MICDYPEKSHQGYRADLHVLVGREMDSGYIEHMRLEEEATYSITELRKSKQISHAARVIASSKSASHDGLAKCNNTSLLRQELAS